MGRTAYQVDRTQTKRELARRAAAAKARGDWRAAELYTAAWHRLNAQGDQDHEVSGLAKRLAAARAKFPLSERMSMG